MNIVEVIKDYEERNFKFIRINTKLVGVEKIYEYLIKHNKNFEEVIVICK